MIQNIIKSFLSELQLANFGFDHHQVGQFFRSQWQSGECSLAYLLYRWTWALCFCVVYAVCLVLQFSDGKFFIFLTNWGIFLCMLTQLMAAVLVTRWHFNIANLRERFYAREYEVGGGVGGLGSRKIAQPVPRSVKFYWLVHGVALHLALIITTVYWAFLHGKMNKPQRFPTLSFITHCLNSVFMLVDLLVVGFPVRILHTIYAMLLPICYCLFTVVYFFCGGNDEYGNHYVYPILDWTKPLRGIATFAGVFCLYIIYGLGIFFVYKVKRFVHRQIFPVKRASADGLI